ncbi:hypothetical protein PMIT1313_00020 [Prochlorococcus marinus str. MIT 1313]|nr:hypothetical protein PMIT1306_00414 [Prochlorococcus sp. MIT 1306]KZR72665.1 hypothetical protein PMIT1313_00020 [Prochlorococcus marinus str. MIT 1313]KZR75195.1 hypothetical protein PMIT1318_00280 [Prochlorococcus marinus str. MIT 1318]KZR75717.1 hypothetical protein PMIT1323_02012 [Prochlorococcus marinus str. MIT 1323]KZR75813.1 hypothetical protein PMIT1320_00806 [Prochlorococcus marinus str. MIT 1320]CAI8208772.1 MAG: Uncharacterised protein [Prochlorococcus marinus str. MIT 9313]
MEATMNGGLLTLIDQRNYLCLEEKALAHQASVKISLKTSNFALVLLLHDNR